MPIFEFRCKKCGEEFEELVSGANEKVACPACGKKSTERKLSTFAFKSGSTFVPASGKSSCATCSTGSSGCSSCGHH